ncbi:hypothetical protein C0993_001557 [Termitomyces sp. T159_Od127]|nr:hypothetical protein C0993_001557 [Termitomyces sp. T159_Od127]
MKEQIAEILDAEGIPYVQFNGQMSAKRRQETIARFSVPITDDATEVVNHRMGNSEDDDNHVFSKEDDDDFLDGDRASSEKKNKGKQPDPKGKGRTFAGSSEGPNPKVMLLSLKSVRMTNVSADVYPLTTLHREPSA